MTTILKLRPLKRNLLQYLFSSLFLASCINHQIPVTLSASQDTGGDSMIKADIDSEYIVFCGNPGVGKSTLLNSIFQKKTFEAGIKIGEGMTIFQKKESYDGKFYIDTPGLADRKLREQAAKEIEIALKWNGNYKIIFVVTTEAGRIKPADLETINTICNAIETPFEYGLVFNKILKKEFALINELSEEQLQVHLEDLHKKPLKTILLAKDNDMEEDKKSFFAKEDENRLKLLQFIAELMPSKIPTKHVVNLDISSFEERIRKIEEGYENRIREMTEKHERLIAEFKTQEQKLSDLEFNLNSELTNTKGVLGFFSSYMVTQLQDETADRSRTLLHEAARNSETKILEELVTKYPDDINKKDKNGYNALHLAANKGKPGVISILLSHGLKEHINKASNSGYTALHLAIYNKHNNIGAVELLLENGASINIADKDNLTPLNHAMNLYKNGKGNRNIEIIHQLMLNNYFNDISKKNSKKFHLHMAAFKGEVEQVEELLKDKGIAKKRINRKIEDSFYTPLHAAAFKGHQEIVTILLQAGADANNKDKSGYKPSGLATSDSTIRDILKGQETSCIIS
jgi:small GTP-binding protein